MGINGPTFVPKVANFYQFRSRFVSKVGFSLIFEPILYELAFFKRCWLVQTRNRPLSLFLAFLAVLFSQFYSNII